MLSICEPNHYYQVFLSQGVGMGIGMGLVGLARTIRCLSPTHCPEQLFVPAVSLPSHYFRARRSLVMGMVFSGPLLSTTSSDCL